MSETNERTKHFPLNWPFEYKGEKITEITLRRPRMSEVRVLSASKKDLVEAGMDTVAALSGKPFELIDTIDPDDYMPMQKWAQEILEKSAPK